MSIELKLFTSCDHKIFEEELTIVAGVNPTADLKYKSNMDASSTKIFRKYWNTTVPEKETALSSGITAGDASIPVVSTTGFNSIGYIKIESEIITYTSIDATHFLGCGRGQNGTIAVSHSINVPVISGWIIGADGKTITFDTGSVITNTDIYPFPIYLCNYVSLLDYCPKCLGSGVMQDARYILTGKVETVSDSEKLKQYIKKAIITAISTNPFHQEYGTYLSLLPGYQITPQLIMKINSTIENIAADLKSYQSDTYNLNKKETLYNISNIDVNVDTTDPRILGINITVLNKEYEEISSTIETIF